MSVIEPELAALAGRAAELLEARGETVGVAEGSCGGLVSSALLAVPGASAYFAGGAVIYTRAAARGFLSGAIPAPPGMRGATEEFVSYLAKAVSVRLECHWGIGEGGAAGPTGNPYGDPAGHVWVAVAGPGDRLATRHALTGQSDRPANMAAFAAVALGLLLEQLEHAG